jgi:hypothetical protein
LGSNPKFGITHRRDLFHLSTQKRSSSVIVPEEDSIGSGLIAFTNSSPNSRKQDKKGPVNFEIGLHLPALTADITLRDDQNLLKRDTEISQEEQSEKQQVLACDF